ncbi:Spy/CpxP family protein refolding chaperone [Hydrogenimonas sp. SS33]|uniref:Spy/CpxP family protein refolding chaperone n=1 Tax=Hydrogenimonas leucolamina TaxID=2954236 RepID=UPI00336BD70B
MKKRLITLMAATAIAAGSAWAQPGQSGMHGPQHMAMQEKQQKHQKKMKKRGMRSVFLIRHGLPHYSMILMKMWDNKKLALTPEQKMKLEAIRRETMKQVMEIAPKVKELRKKIVQAAKSGAKPETLYADVDKLASLKAQATKVQLACMAKTRAVLTPEQMKLIEKHVKHMRKKHHKKKHDK